MFLRGVKEAMIAGYGSKPVFQYKFRPLKSDSLLGNASSWMGACPCDLRGRGTAGYASSFAFDSYEPIRVWGINDLLCQPTGSEGGFFTRHLYVLFEDVANLFAESGIRLSIDGFTWDGARVHPFRKNQTVYTSQQGAV